MPLLRQHREQHRRASRAPGIACPRRGWWRACARVWPEQFGVSVTIIRLAFVLGVIIGWGMGLVLYLALWVIMPTRPSGPVEVTTSYRRVD